MKNEGRALIGAGDDGVRKVLGIPKSSNVKNAAKAPDYLSATKGNKLAVSEAKGGGDIDLIEEVLPQLTNALNKLSELNLLGDVERVELILKKGAKIKQADYKVWNGYVVQISKGNTPITPKGFKNFVQVIHL